MGTAKREEKWAHASHLFASAQYSDVEKVVTAS
jgi:hypothetical protein